MLPRNVAPSGRVPLRSQRPNRPRQLLGRQSRGNFLNPRLRGAVPVLNLPRRRDATLRRNPTLQKVPPQRHQTHRRGRRLLEDDLRVRGHVRSVAPTHQHGLRVLDPGDRGHHVRPVYVLRAVHLLCALRRAQNPGPDHEGTRLLHPVSAPDSGSDQRERAGVLSGGESAHRAGQHHLSDAAHGTGRVAGHHLVLQLHALRCGRLYDGEQN
uniref:(northern house mosquito) hypothetical protein n=1 Tax=Culex pipiens TaxID=7175 RepID=A0A8D8A1D1_CULPI